MGISRHFGSFAQLGNTYSDANKSPAPIVPGRREIGDMRKSGPIFPIGKLGGWENAEKWAHFPNREIR